MSKWRTTKAPNVLITGALGPCVGVAIFNSDLQRGYLAHSRGLSLDPQYKMGRQVARHASRPDSLRAWATGAGPSEEARYYELTLAVRVETLKYLADLGIKDVTTEWVQDSIGVAELTLDCATGEGRITIEEDFAVLDDLDDYP